jgi:hypothetical protein
MTSVALYGFAEHSRDGIWNSRADQVWSIAWAYEYDVPRLDRILEIHPIWMQAQSKKAEYIKARQHWAWLKKNKTIPIYMMNRHPEVPKAVRYPLEDVQALVPEARRKKVFTSSFDFLMALAILEGFTRIEVYGFEMGSDTEYRYQREGAAYWISQCDARGIELVLPENSMLLKNKIYCYEGGAMIYRQDLERIKLNRETQKSDGFARLSFLQGQISNEKDEQKKLELQTAITEQAHQCLLLSGSLQEIEYLLKEIDLEEPVPDFKNPFKTIETSVL